MIWILMLLFAQSPAAPGRPVFVASTSTVNSALPAALTWTVDASEPPRVYDLSLDAGAWTAITPQPVDAWTNATVKAFSTDLGILKAGTHRVVLRACTLDRALCTASAPVSVDAVPPTQCVTTAWGPWTDYPAFWLLNDAETEQYRYHYRYRGVATPPDPGAPPCPPLVESEKESRVYVPPPLDPVTVAYVKTDSTTQGTWIGVYGKLGFVPAAQTTTSLPFASVTFAGGSFWTWAASTTDVRGLQKPGTPLERYATGVYTPPDIDIDIKSTDAIVREVAVYAVDWDSTSRAQSFTVFDSQGHVLSTVNTGPELKAGAWYVWRISGHARIRVTRSAGVNAVVLAVLFGS